MILNNFLKNLKKQEMIILLKMLVEIYTKYIIIKVKYYKDIIYINGEVK